MGLQASPTLSSLELDSSRAALSPIHGWTVALGPCRPQGYQLPKSEVSVFFPSEEKEHIQRCTHQQTQPFQTVRATPRKISTTWEADLKLP